MTLIDPGATHNFISLTLVSTLNLPVTETTSFLVRMGSGDKEPGKGICKGVMLHLREIDIVDDFLALRLGSADVILGLKWLRTLGKTEHDWKKQIMTFNIGNKSIVLTGEPTLGRSLISLRALGKKLAKEQQGILVELCNIEANLEQTSRVPDFLTDTLEKYQELFEEPQGLPPKRGIEHQIILQEGVPPVSVRPYRYPHFQKDEIERMIREMLTTGVIQPSTSPFW